ncbi:DUF6879 family protein [Nonomuraea sp. CA-143628]|uniref:DUF6879 family protein n=1 Tax=Nonomuraea sp. CA-143628 TaxID=3239997 RepID=UPI003D8AB80A
MALDFVGMDPDSPKNECPAVFVDPETGDMYFQGRTVTDPAVLERIARDSPIAADESVVWHPQRMAPIVMEAVSGTYERNKQGPGLPSFERMLENAERSAVHLEMRDTYDATDPAFLKWQQDGSTGGLKLSYDAPRAGDWAYGVLRLRQNSKRSGRPDFNTVNTRRQWRCMAKRLCQVCTRSAVDPDTGWISWLLSSEGGGHERDGFTNAPPTCKACIPEAIA